MKALRGCENLRLTGVLCYSKSDDVNIIIPREVTRTFMKVSFLSLTPDSDQVIQVLITRQKGA